MPIFAILVERACYMLLHCTPPRPGSAARRNFGSELR